MSFPPEHSAHFRTLQSLQPPRVTRRLAWMIIIGMLIAGLILWLAPWVQTAAGTGQVVALDPNDQPQAITALVPGRVERWHVQDGQEVVAGQPVASIVDIDPQLLDRLRAERAQVLAEIAASDNALAAARSAVQVAGLDVRRSGELLSEGLIARRDFELSQIKVADGNTKVAEARGKIAESRAKLNRIDVSLSRQEAQAVNAPRAGRIQGVNAVTAGAYVSAGQVLATLTPENPARVVELMVDGRDIALIHRGRPVRLEFEGWPAIQISGWPSASTGLFSGRVRAVDPSSQPNGLFRVLVEEPPGAPWPGPQFIRLGAKVRGWIQMERVRVGYELWRQLNDFPLEFRRPADETGPMTKTGAETAAK